MPKLQERRSPLGTSEEALRSLAIMILVIPGNCQFSNSGQQSYYLPPSQPPPALINYRF
jgi:hypothetical protein